MTIDTEDVRQVWKSARAVNEAAQMLTTSYPSWSCGMTYDGDEPSGIEVCHDGTLAFSLPYDARAYIILSALIARANRK